MAAREIKTTLALDGEKQFKQGMDDAYRAMKILGSETKLNTAIYGENAASVEGLAKKGEILGKQISQQKEIVAALSKAVEDSSAAYGESDKRTDAYRIKLNNAEAALVRMEGELGKNEEAIQGFGKETDEAEKKTSKWRESLVKVGETLSKSVVAGAKAAAVAVGTMAVAAAGAAFKLGKEVVKSFADYEQLVGGVDTLFKKSSQAVQDYASQAFKTSGLSANEYMETVTSFSASLIQSLGGDTDKASKIADMAIVDMSDNANKMGTDMKMIQNAYQGFAKQNYTMLDNLKLGYGGTKGEMTRLLEDASKIAGITFDLSSFSDVAQAINVIQKEMGIAGTTALEATETITGSLGGMKAAFANLVTGLGISGADINTLLGNVIEAFQNVVKNITPVIENIITALPVALNGMMAAVSSLLPSILSTVTELFVGALNMLVGLLPQLTPVAVDALLTITRALIDNLPMIVEAATQLIFEFITGIESAIPQIMPAAVQGVVVFASGIMKTLPLIIKSGVSAVLALVDGILDSLPEIISAGIQMVVAIVKGLIDSIPKLIATMPKLIDAIIQTIVTNLPIIITAGIQLTIALIEGIIKAIPQLLAAMPQIISSIVSGLGAGMKSIWDVGVNIVRGLWDGISSSVQWLSDQVTGWLSGMWSGIKNFFGIKSPSKLMADTVGKPMAQGIALGLGKNLGLVGNELNKITPMLNMNVAAKSEQSVTANFSDSALARIVDGLAAAMTMRDDMTIVLNDREFGRAVRKVAMA